MVMKSYPCAECGRPEASAIHWTTATNREIRSASHAYIEGPNYRDLLRLRDRFNQLADKQSPADQRIKRWIEVRIQRARKRIRRWPEE